MQLGLVPCFLEGASWAPGLCTYIPAAAGMEVIGSNVQAPGLVHRAAKWRSRGSGSRHSPVGMRRRPRPGSPDRFPRQRRARGWEEHTLCLGLLPGAGYLLSACLSDDSSLSPALIWSLLTGSPDPAIEDSSGISPHLPFPVAPPCFLRPSLTLAVARRFPLLGTGVDRIPWPFSQNTLAAWLISPANQTCLSCVTHLLLSARSLSTSPSPSVPLAFQNPI